MGGCKSFITKGVCEFNVLRRKVSSVTKFEFFKMITSSFDRAFAFTMEKEPVDPRPTISWKGNWMLQLIFATIVLQRKVKPY